MGCKTDMGPLMPSRPSRVSNEVLLEKITQLKENQDRNIHKTESALEKLDTRLTQNFNSMAEVLKQGYVTKEDLLRVEADIEYLMKEKISESKMRPYLLVWNTIALLALTGFVGLVGRMVYSYVEGGPPGP